MKASNNYYYYRDQVGCLGNGHEIAHLARREQQDTAFNCDRARVVEGEWSVVRLRLPFGLDLSTIGRHYFMQGA